MKPDSNDIIKLLEYLIGPTEPYGDSAIDLSRETNLRTLIDVTDWCLDKLYGSASFARSAFASANKLGELAKGTLEDVVRWVNEILPNI